MKEYTLNAWREDPKVFQRVINKTWMLEPRGSYKGIPKTLYKSDFVEEFNDLVTLLSRVIGIPISWDFEDWMWYFVDKILCGDATFSWPKIINNNLHEKMMALKPKDKPIFYMTSYVVYFLEVKYPIKGLITKGELESKKVQTMVHDHYPQL
jgi:hypothetical protein